MRIHSDDIGLVFRNQGFGPTEFDHCVFSQGVSSAPFAFFINGTDWTLKNKFKTYYKNTMSICAGAGLGMFYLWPMIALQLGIKKPSFWFFKLTAYVILGCAMIILGNVPGLELKIG